MNLIEDILNGKHDEDLESLSNALNGRKKIIREQKTAIALCSLNVDDIVVLRNLTPKYVNGSKGIITEKRRKKFSVKLIDPSYRVRQRFSGNVVVPATCIEKV